MHDIAISMAGDLIPNGAGGLLEVDAEAVDYQDINWRILTNDPEQILHTCGANLEDLKGLPNTPTTAAQGKAQILRALTYDGRFLASDLTLTAVPTGPNSIQFFIGLASASKLATTTPYASVVVNLSA